MATGRPQKGMNSRNHHDNLSQSGQRQSNQTPKPKRGGGGSANPSLTQMVFGPGAKVTGHGPGKRKRK